MSHDVLLVDDDAALRVLLVRVLSERGCRVFEAGSIAEARASIGEGRVSVAIVDRLLPDGDGTSLLDELRAADPQVALVYISAYLPEGDELGRLHARVRLASVLGKPFSPEQLLAEIGPWLAPAVDDEGGDEVFAALRAEYAVTLDEQVRELEAAFAGGDLDGVRRIAHRLHGTAGTYGFDSVSAAAGAIESLLPARTRGETTLAGLAQALREAVDEDAAGT